MKIVSVTLRFPAKKTQYGYAEAVVEFDGDWTQLGNDYREAVKAFQAGENSDKVKFQGSGKTVTKDDIAEAIAEKYSTPLAPVEMTYDPRDPEGPGITTPEEAEALIKSELGATNIDDILNEDVDEETPEWEKPPPPPSDDDWDF